ncbi:ATP-binding protein [Flavobacteriaceae bacterium W22]|nr:ATP-binding protein [Flavobacteriaceae bacterium W22]
MRPNYLVIILLIFYSCNKIETRDEVYPTKLYEKAKYFQNENISDSAFYYFNLAKNDYVKINDSTGASKSLVNMAIIQCNNGDFYGSIETSLEADKLLRNESDSTVKSTLAANYNNMAISSSFLKNYEESVAYYKKTLQFSNDAENRYIYNNNIGDALILLGQYKEAKKYLELAIFTKDSLIYAKVLNNIARAKFLDDQNYNPLPELNKALIIRQNNKDIEGQNSSFSTLADYYLEKNAEKSLLYSYKLLETSEKIKKPEDQINALQRLIMLDKPNYLKYFKRLTAINDSTQTSRNKAKNQFAVIRYDVEQKDAENKNLKLRDAENEINIIYLSFGLGILIITLIIGHFWNEKRKKSIKIEKEKEKELEVKNTELRYSKKVHDKVANKVYHVMSELENTENMNKEVLLYKLDGIYQISRDISYDKNDVALEHNFSQHLSQMLKSYSSENIKVPIIGNEESLWEDVGDHSKVEVFYILQELMTNMKKHSKADKVLLDFSRENDLINIVYSDNGIGISEFSPKNGIQNTESRINSIGGTINFDTKTENGLKITLSFPAKN